MRWTIFLLLFATMAGCADLSDDVVDTDGDGLSDDRERELGTDPNLADTDGDGILDGDEVLSGDDPLAMPPALTFGTSIINERSAEPSIGITPDNCAFFVALEKVFRSCDGGSSWERVDGPLMSPTSNDPYLWVDTETGRVFDIQMGPLTHTWIAWSDDNGETWLGNPYDQGPTPVNDHIKVGSGPWVNGENPGYGTIGDNSPLFERAVYFCYNKLVGVYCYTSFDGGATFPVGGNIFGQAGSGGLHGAITTAPDGTVYVPPRTAEPTVYFSKDNGLTWEGRTMGEDVGTPNPRKNSEVGTDSASNAYHIWTGGDMRVYMSRSLDSGNTWEQSSHVVSAPGVISTTFPHIDAGDPGRVAVAYLGSSNADILGTPDIDGNDWDGNPHTAPEGVEYHMWLSVSHDATEANATWTHYQLSDDPVQVGSICISSGDCRDIGGSNRNLLDFNDLHIGPDGRIWVAYADGCTGACADGSDRRPETSRTSIGTIATQLTGEGLYAEVGELLPL